MHLLPRAGGIALALFASLALVGQERRVRPGLRSGEELPVRAGSVRETGSCKGQPIEMLAAPGCAE